MVREPLAQRAAEEKLRPEALVERTSGSLVVAAPAEGPGVEPDLAVAGVRDLVWAVGPDPKRAQEAEAVELFPGSDGVAGLGRGKERERAVHLQGEMAPH